MAYAIGTALPVGAVVSLATALFRGRPDQAGEADRRFTDAVADADPDEATRREALAALVGWATERSGTWPEIEMVARGLGLTPPDLATLVGTEAARAEPVRALARAARRACRGEEWRAFLVGQA